ncbi:MAG: hypothetical protein ACRDTK_11865, partial [Mycobacterium sp.]
LDAPAKRTLNAAAVLGSRFDTELLAALEADPTLDELVKAELIDQIKFSPRAEYAFRHPLIRAVAYESQLKSDRAELHRRLAAAIEQSDENAPLIAEHLEAAGDLHEAFAWHIAPARGCGRTATSARHGSVGSEHAISRTGCPPMTLTAPRCASHHGPGSVQPRGAPGEASPTLDSTTSAIWQLRPMTKCHSPSEWPAK